MSMMIRLLRSEGARKGLSFLTSKEAVRSVVCRSSSTTSKKNDSLEDEPYVKKDTWVSYGFCRDDKELDRHGMHQTMFVTVSICLVFGALVIAYLPDPSLHDWSQREAFLQLRYREEHGLPLIDPNLIDPSKVKLPSDEELGETEIII